MACDGARQAASACPATAVRNLPQNRIAQNIGRRFLLYGTVCILNYWGASSYPGTCVQLAAGGQNVKVITAREIDMQHVPSNCLKSLK